MGARAKTKIGPALPVFPVVTRLIARQGKVGNLILDVTCLYEKFAGAFIRIGKKIFIGKRVGVIGISLLQRFSSQPALFVRFKKVNRDMFRLKPQRLLKRTSPAL